MSIFLAFILSMILTYFLKIFGLKYGFCDIPNNDILKIHTKTIPYLGGIGIFLSFVSIVLINWHPIWLIFLLGFAGVFLLFGLFDDLKWKRTVKSKPVLKLIVEIFLIVIFLITSILLINLNNSNFTYYEWIILGILSFIWIMSVMNSINTSDGLDGLAGILILISLVGLFIIFKLQASSFALLVAVLFGAISGFLIFNLPPAKIFMGDNGSHFLGFMLAVLGMIIVFFNLSFLNILGIVFLIGLPIFDLIFVAIARLLKHKSIIRGSRDHLYDRLMRQLNGDLGKTLLIYSLIQAIFVGSGVLLILI